MKKPKQIILGIAILIILAFIALCMYRPWSNYAINETANGKWDKETLEPVFVPDGWKVYSNEEWSISFAYPSSWRVREIQSPLNKEVLADIYLEGDGYEIVLTQGDRGLPSGMKVSEQPYVFGDIVSKTWQRETDRGYEQVVRVEVPVMAKPFLINILTSDATRKLSDQFLSTLIFLQ